MHVTTQDERNQLLTTNLWLNLVNINICIFIHSLFIDLINNEIFLCQNCTNILVIFCIGRKKANCESFEAQKAHQKCIPRIAFNAVISLRVPWCDFFTCPSSRQMRHSIPSNRINWDLWSFLLIICTIKTRSGHWSSIINEIINLSFRSSKHIWNIHLGLSLLSNELEVYWILNGPLYNWKPYSMLA